MRRQEMNLSKDINRFLKVLIYCILIVTFLWKAYEAWHKYNLGDKMIVTEIDYPKKQTFPSVTICRTVIDKSKNVIEMMKQDIKIDSWLYSKFDNENLTQNWEAREMSRYMTPESYNTSCFTFSPPKKISPGLRHKLELFIQTNTSYLMYILLHDSMNNIPFYGDIFGTNSMALPFNIQDNFWLTMYLAVSTEVTIKLNTDKQPCREIGIKQTMCDCMEEFFQQAEGCTLPWQQNRTKVIIDKVCNDANLKHYQNYMNGHISDGSYEEVIQRTGCIPNCKQTIYPFKKSMEVSLPYGYANHSMSVSFFLVPTGVTLKREVLVFDGLELIGNVGGYLGLLLGWSAMSVVQWHFKLKSQ